MANEWSHTADEQRVSSGTGADGNESAGEGVEERSLSLYGTRRYHRHAVPLPLEPAARIKAMQAHNDGQLSSDGKLNPCDRRRRG